MKIYGSPTSPFVRKVRVFAIERGIVFDFVKEDPWQRSAQLLAFTPLGKVPVLEADDGRVVIDSLSIMEFLDAAGDPAGQLLPPPGPARWDQLQWHALAHGIIDAVVARVLETRRPPEYQMADRMAREEERIAATLDMLENRISALNGSARDKPDFGSLMLATALRYLDFRYPHDWKTSRPGLASMVEKLATRTSFRETEPPV